MLWGEAKYLRGCNRSNILVLDGGSYIINNTFHHVNLEHRLDCPPPKTFSVVIILDRGDQVVVFK